MTDNDLQQAITAIKAGDKASGRSILERVIKQQPSSEMAWLWLAVCQTSDKGKVYCLEKSLQINPTNQKTREAIEKLQKQIIEEPSIDLLLSQNLNPDLQNQATKRRTPKTKNMWMVGIVIILILIVGEAVIFFVMQSGKSLSGITSNLIQIDPNSPENVALRFFENKYKDEDLSADMIYTWAQWGVIWEKCGATSYLPGEKKDNVCEIKDVITREGKRVDSKEVTIAFIWGIDKNNETVYGFAEILVEKLHNRWVISCAGTKGMWRPADDDLLCFE